MCAGVHFTDTDYLGDSLDRFIHMLDSRGPAQLKPDRARLICTEHLVNFRRTVKTRAREYAVLAVDA